MFSYQWYGAYENLVVSSVGLKRFYLLGSSSSSRASVSSLGCVISFSRYLVRKLVISVTFHYQLMHLLIKTLSQFTSKTTHAKNVCDAYLKLIYKPQHVSVSPPTIIRGQFPYLAHLLRVSLPASSHSSL